MTIINTNYSTIEEAWGVDRIDRKKPVKKATCNLYENRNKQRTKPYRNNTLNDMNYKEEQMFVDTGNEDYDKYYGYADARAHSRTSKPQKNHKAQYKIRGRKQVAVNPKTNTYAEIENDNVYEEAEVYEEDDVYDREVYEEDNREVVTSPYEEVYDEDDDNYLTNINKSTQNLDRYIEEEIEEEMYPRKGVQYRNMTTNLNEQSNNTSDAQKQMLDLSIYTLSGVLVIFMMEQFVQMGIKIKTFN